MADGLPLVSTADRGLNAVERQSRGNIAQAATGVIPIRQMELSADTGTIPGAATSKIAALSASPEGSGLTRAPKPSNQGVTITCVSEKPNRCTSW